MLHVPAIEPTPFVPLTLPGALAVGLFIATDAFLWRTVATSIRIHTVAGNPALSAVLFDFDDYDQVVKLFRALEAVRLNACIEHELAMMSRQMTALQKAVGVVVYTADRQGTVTALRKSPAGVERTYQVRRCVRQDAATVRIVLLPGTGL